MTELNRRRLLSAASVASAAATLPAPPSQKLVPDKEPTP